jgi:3-hydroxyisobutyrate dehydrogenase-like beta-hydroxyacid dehydrogenase
MRLALLGTGLMGEPVAERLIAVGHALAVWNRSPEKSAPLQGLGARVCASPAEAVAGAEAVLLFLADAPAIEQVVFDPPVPLQGVTLIQCGTIAPAQSRAIAERIGQAGGAYLEAPVLGSIPEAREGRLLLMVGGERESFERWRPLLEVLGPDPTHVGPVGQAAALKLALNQLIGGLTASFALSLGLVRREGVEVETFMQILRKSALYAPTFDKKLQRMQDRDFARPNFPVRHLLKDMRLCAEACTQDGLAVDQLEGVIGILERALDRRLTDLDYSALYEIVDPPSRS